MRSRLILFVFVFQLVYAKHLSVKDLNPDCAIENVYVVYVDDIVTVTWSPPSSCPSNIYKVQYSVNDEQPWNTIDSLMPGVPMARLPLEKLTCERVSVMVLVKENDETVGESDIVHLERQLEEITNFEIEQTTDALQLSWNPIVIETCKVTYSVKYTVGLSEHEEHNLDEPKLSIPLTPYKPCTSFDIKINAVSNQIMSPILETKYEIKIPAVKDLQLRNDNGRVIVDFKPTRDIPLECGEVDYRVIQEDHECFKSDYFIIPLSTTGTEGVMVQKGIVRQPGPIKNLQVTQNGDKVNFEWQASIGAEDCNMAYFIKYNSKTWSVYNTNFVLNAQLESCKVELAQVIPLIILEDDYDYVEGKPSDINLVGDIGAVQHLKCSLNSNKVECSWERPLNSDNCQKMEYEIKYFDGVNTEPKVIEDTNIEFNTATRFCKFWFGVQPLGSSDDQMWKGDFVEANIDGCDNN